MMTNGELFLGGLFFGALFFGIAELFGRSKHIGRGWSWLLLWGCFVIPGIIAMIVSPSAKKEPTKPSQIRRGFGISLMILGGLFMIVVVKGYAELSDYYYNYGQKALLRMQTAQGIAFISLGLYLYNLGRGLVKNTNPKYYITLPELPKFDATPPVSGAVKSAVQYFVAIDGQKQGPYSLDEVKGMLLAPDTLVWRHPMKDWSKASGLKELEFSLSYQPPSLPSDTISEHEPPEIKEAKIETPFKEEDYYKGFTHGPNKKDGFDKFIGWMFSLLVLLWFISIFIELFTNNF